MALYSSTKPLDDPSPSTFFHLYPLDSPASIHEAPCQLPKKPLKINLTPYPFFYPYLFSTITSKFYIITSSPLPLLLNQPWNSLSISSSSFFFHLSSFSSLIHVIPLTNKRFSTSKPKSLLTLLSYSFLGNPPLTAAPPGTASPVIPPAESPTSPALGLSPALTSSLILLCLVLSPLFLETCRLFNFSTLAISKTSTVEFPWNLASYRDSPICFSIQINSWVPFLELLGVFFDWKNSILAIIYSLESSLLQFLTISSVLQNWVFQEIDYLGRFLVQLGS